MESLRGQLLIASPKIVDPNFRRVVVYMAEHTEEGAMGLVLNRPSETLVADAVPPLAPVVDDAAVVYVGGPVEPAAVVVLAARCAALAPRVAAVLEGGYNLDTLPALVRAAHEGFGS